MIEFQVSTRHTGTRRVIKVMIYENRTRLQRAAKKRDGFFGLKQSKAWYDKTAALTNCITLVPVGENADDPEVPGTPYITIRFAKDALMGRPTEIIAHEATHASMYLYRHDVQKTIPNMEKEEILCYLVGDITRKLVNKLYEKAIV